ncbi:MAG: FAD-dependent oxidoreductase [Aquificaceae bacterium]|nr:FAD-dependent oxidoreductase [Aquificaceae bacterium]MDW8237040.1 FAD-dependent oxidoreductase [Aquificaceae bacterium]
MARILVLGSGIVGLCCAFRLSLDGHSVKVITKSISDPTSWVAGGMLAPFSEGLSGELLNLSIKSLELYPAFLDAIYQTSGQRVELHKDGLLRLFLDKSAIDESQHYINQREDFFINETRLTAVSFKNEGYLDPTSFMRALLSSLSRLSIKIITDKIISVERDNSKILRLIGIKDIYSADYFVLCPGAWAGELLQIPVFPTKGQALLLETTVYPKTLYSDFAYIIPRENLTYVGATSEPKDFTKGNTIGGILKLIEGFLKLFPEHKNLKVSKTLYGFRPSTPDGLPIIDFGENFALLTGHHRNGILLAPVSAEIVSNALSSKAPKLEAFSLNRFLKTP